jgi:hypothetical protein
MSEAGKRTGRVRLEVEVLEDRCTPAQFGIPWVDSLHLTLSFTPDGTVAPGDVTSSLNTALDAQMPQGVWQDAILRAFQAWAQVANVNIGVVEDDGSPFGIAGASQGDPRFGDIRIGGVPMTPDMLATATPPPAFVAGTFAGDVFINTAATFTPDSLYAVALHEAGHALGLDENNDPNSVMFAHLNHATTLSTGDISAIQAMYGVRAGDLNEGSNTNNLLKNATQLKDAGQYSPVGTTPLVAYGDITTPSDVDSYALSIYSGYSGPVSFRLLTSGVSLLDARLTIYDPTGNVVGQAIGAGDEGAGLTVTLAHVNPGVYYAQVDAAPGSAFQVGRYGLAATFDSMLRPLATPVDTVLRGPYELLQPNDIQSLFVNPTTVLFRDDAHTDDTANTAVQLKPGPGQPSPMHLQAMASLTDSTDVDFYQIKAPNAAAHQPWVLTTTVRALQPYAFGPEVEILDSKLNPVAAQVLVNQDGTFTIQASVAEGGTYYLRVHGNGSGNYALDALFGTVTADVQTFATGTLPQPTSTAAYNLYIGQTQLLSLALSASGAGGVHMDIVNSAGDVVFTLTAGIGETVTGVGTLVPGAYTVRFTTIGATGPVGFTVSGTGLTDPIGPVLDSTILAPQYQAPNDPTQFLYPNGTLTPDPLLWLFSVVTSPGTPTPPVPPVPPLPPVPPGPVGG